MAELEKVLKDIVLGSVGAVAAVVEKGGEIARTLVEKGQATVEQNQDTVDQIRQKVRSVCERMNGDAGRDEDVQGLSFTRTEQGVMLQCPLDEITPEQAENIRALIARAGEPAGEDVADQSPLTVRLASACPGVSVELDMRLLDEKTRGELLMLLPSDEPEENG